LVGGERNRLYDVLLQVFVLFFVFVILEFELKACKAGTLLL
jgi:hypothetical protein